MIKLCTSCPNTYEHECHKRCNCCKGRIPIPLGTKAFTNSGICSPCRLKCGSFRNICKVTEGNNKTMDITNLTSEELQAELTRRYNEQTVTITQAQFDLLIKEISKEHFTSGYSYMAYPSMGFQDLKKKLGFKP